MFKIKKYSIIVFAIVFILINVSSVFAQEKEKIEGIVWVKSMAEAQKLSEKEGKLILLKWWADWCRPCHEMEAETFSDNGIIKHINTNYIPLALDSDIEYKLANKMQMVAMPTLQILKSGGEEIKRHEGKLNPEEFMKWSKIIK